MFFHFCGGDVPDWLLSQLAEFTDVDEDTIAALLKETVRSIMKRELKHALCERMDMDRGRFKAILAVMHYIISSAARYDVSVEVLRQELLQLGLSEAQSDAMASTHDNACAAIREQLLATMMRLPTVTKLAVHKEEGPAQIQFSRSDGSSVRCSFEGNQLDSLLADLRDARQTMASLTSVLHD